MNSPFRLVRVGSDHLIEVLTKLLSLDVWFEFKPLFLRVYADLRERKAIGGGEEMLRLRTYEKLQNLVQHGFVEKNGKQYRGIVSRLENLSEHIAASHCGKLMESVRRP